MVDNMSLISVIIPVYKVEAYLDRCLESVVNQTYRDLEIILVDDGSPDRCPQMCDEWARRDERIRVIHKENGGASQARNMGMKEAHGEYIGFVDSDDWVEARFFERLYITLCQTEADLVECEYDLVKDNVSQVSPSLSICESCVEILSFEKALAEFIQEKKIKHVIWNKLYKKSTIQKILFTEGIICEDEFWIWEVLLKARKVSRIGSILYHYFLSSGSVMRQEYSTKRLICIEAFKKRYLDTKKHFPVLFPIANRAYLSACFFHYQMLCRNSKVDPYGVERRKLHQQFLEGDFSLLLSLSNAKYKFWYRLFQRFPGFTCMVRNLLNIGL